MKKSLSLVIAFIMLFGFLLGGLSSVYAAEEYAWVLVDTYQFPISEYFRAGSYWSYSAKLEENMGEVRITATEKNPPDLHASYTWTNPPNVIKPKEKVSIRIAQEVISYNVKNYGISISPYIKADTADLNLGYGTSSAIAGKGVYEDGKVADAMKLGLNGDPSFQKSTFVDLSLEFFDASQAGTRRAIYVGVYGGPPGSIGERYTYEWKEVPSAVAKEDQGDIIDIRGEWDIVANGFGGILDITNQTGSEFTGTLNLGTENDTLVTKGKIKGDTISFTRAWTDWDFTQDYIGSLKIEDGMMKISGTFISDRITDFKWRAEKEAPAGLGKPEQKPGNSADTFEFGSRIMWNPAKGLGYRLYRSTSANQLGISVTDFYITSTSYADVNVEPNTTYYYTVKPILAEAKPFEGIDEKLGDAIATYVVKTGPEIYKAGSFKHFIILTLESPDMSVDGVNQEVDPGRGTMPLIITGRTMVPIRAIVEAMGGTVEWDGSTQKITLKARDNVVEMWIGKTDIKVNGKTGKMDIAPSIKNSRTFVPVRFAAENLNCKVDWINTTREVVIVYEEK